MLDAVIFDLGGVLLRSGGPHDLAARYPDHDPKQLQELLMGPYHLDTDHPWHRLERGEITMQEVKAANRTALAAAGIVLPQRQDSGRVLESADRNTDMIALVHDLRAAGIKTAMLTNNVVEFREQWWPKYDWPSIFDDIVDSSEHGVRKPNPAIYRLSLQRLGVEASRSAFVDDVVSNVEAARNVGMHGFHCDPATAGAEAIAGVRELAAL